ncbi:helix-turn-helix transcriptional regulator [Halomicrobium sp. IBSBa]|uniref:PadR family transcriptional regulator n=1 Tax=Halomicrobium sp. IBSBa TaxID=2778916 RepID=UPI001AC001E0|nr:helix-turn-helix transcriptional regulator [Halomicrobium sp. IBSBa]MBO4249475.1 helix-turn-helix transcriptional regulator [Halomicrobium sp. IBSBa]
MTEWHALSAFQRDLLTAIAAVDDEPYGLALKEYLDERYPDSINHSRLYQNLDRLADAGLVTIDRHALDKRTNAYRLTDDGRRQLQHQARALASVCDVPQPAADGGLRK